MREPREAQGKQGNLRLLRAMEVSDCKSGDNWGLLGQCNNQDKRGQSGANWGDGGQRLQIQSKLGHLGSMYGNQAK